MCIAAAVLSLIAALMGWGQASLPYNPGWALLGAAGLFIAVGGLVRRAITEAREETEEVLEQAERFENELQRHKQALDGLAEGLKSALFVCDFKAGIQYANHRALEMFRFEAPAGRSILAVTISYELEQLVLNASREEGALEAELSFSFPEDRTTLARAWREPNGDRVFVSLYDITELRRLERVRQDFVANVSHELRTPLAAIRSLAETLHDEPRAALEKRSDYLQRIVSEVDRLSLVVSDLLVLSAAESGPVRKQACDIAAAIRACVALLEDKARAKNLDVSYSGPEQLTIEANGAQLNQVFINLIDNAINYTAEGKVEVEARLEDQEVVVEVSDTGVGIPSEHLPRLFERFYRVDKGRSRATGGTGLGLSIVKHIVEAHGGTVKVESVFREGSTFTVRLPLGAASQEALQTAAESPSAD